MDAITLVEADPRWPAAFAQEAAVLQRALAHEPILAIEHIGSTAVPGLCAKPIIDLLVLVPVLAAARPRLIPGIEGLGYACWHENPRTDRLFFVKGLPPAPSGRTHHVHVLEPGPEADACLRFRNHLRRCPEDARRYAELKRALATTFREDREGYTAAKTAFVQEILRRAQPLP